MKRKCTQGVTDAPIPETRPFRILDGTGRLNGIISNTTDTQVLTCPRVTVVVVPRTRAEQLVTGRLLLLSIQNDVRRPIITPLFQNAEENCRNLLQQLLIHLSIRFAGDGLRLPEENSHNDDYHQRGGA